MTSHNLMESLMNCSHRKICSYPSLFVRNIYKTLLYIYIFREAMSTTRLYLPDHGPQLLVGKHFSSFIFFYSIYFHQRYLLLYIFINSILFNLLLFSYLWYRTVYTWYVCYCSDWIGVRWAISERVLFHTVTLYMFVIVQAELV